MKRLGIAIAALSMMIGSATTANAQRKVRVNIESTPPGASVYLDSADGAALGTTPMRRVRIPKGEHTLIFKLANHADGSLKVNIRRWNETFRMTLNAQSKIAINAGNNDTAGAAIRVDGQEVGTVPWTGVVTPGRHLIQIGKEGFDTFTQWAELSGGQVLSLPVALVKTAPDTGTLVVDSNVPGAPVYVDGDPRGVTPTTIEGLTAGDHQLEVRPADGEPVRQTVRVVAKDKTTVMLNLKAAGGTLKAICNVENCTIKVDGEVVGNAPYTGEKIAAGEHIVQASAPNHRPATQTVAIEAGAVKALNFELAAIAKGALVVNAAVEGATVFVDGNPKGPPPIVIEDIPPGTHAVIVRAPGFDEFRTTCVTGPDQKCEINAEMNAKGVNIRVVSNVADARLFIDGEDVGPIPFEGTVPVGNHKMEVKAPGMRDHVEQANLQLSNETRLFDVALIGVNELTDEQRAEQARETSARTRESMSRAAATLPDDLAALDFSVGWPYLLEGRIAIGFLDFLEVGAALRTNFRLTEFEARLKAGYRPAKQFSVGGLFRIGGGVGPNRSWDSEASDSDSNFIDQDIVDRPTTYNLDPVADKEFLDELSMENTHGRTSNFFLSIEARGTLHFGPAGGLTFHVGLDWYRDNWAWNASDDECRSTYGCPQDDPDTMDINEGDRNGNGTPGEVEDHLWNDPDGPTGPMAGSPDFAGGILPETQSDVRVRLGVTLEIIFSKHWNGWLQFEGAFGPDRRVLGDLFNAGFSDTQLYTRLGLTYKFGDVGEYVDFDDDAN